MKRGFFDCVWFWRDGEWHEAEAGKREELRAAGFVAVDGRRSIGAPEGPPKSEVQRS